MTRGARYKITQQYLWKASFFCFFFTFLGSGLLKGERSILPNWLDFLELCWRIFLCWRFVLVKGHEDIEIQGWKVAG